MRTSRFITFNLIMAKSCKSKCVVDTDKIITEVISACLSSFCISVHESFTICLQEVS
jgi:hypothetical protein